eukprot:s2_g44.t1
MDEATKVVDQAREAAVEKVVCPICFEALSDLPNQVGALTFEGRRVETALYHRDCVLNCKTHRLVFESETGRAVSPLTRKQVDNFKVMPSLTESNEWAQFLDWNGSGELDVQKVCFAVVALLPVDDAYARKLVLQVLNLEESEGVLSHRVSQQEVVDTLLPQIRRQLRRLIKSPRPRPPEICRNSSKDELLAWYKFWDSKKQGSLNVPTLTLAVVTTFHTALAKTADAQTKDAIAHSFLTELGLRESDTITESQFLEKMAPQLVANLPVAIERGHPSGSFDPKLPLTLHLRDIKTGTERPLYFDVAGEVTIGDLRKATLRRFPVILCRRKVKLFVMGQMLEDDFMPLFHIRGIYEGATVNFMPGQRITETALSPKRKSWKNEVNSFLDDLDGFDDASTVFDSDEEHERHENFAQSAPVSRRESIQSAERAKAADIAARRASSHQNARISIRSSTGRNSIGGRSSVGPTTSRSSVGPTTSNRSSLGPTSARSSLRSMGVQTTPQEPKRVKLPPEPIAWDIPSERPAGEEGADIPASKECALLSPRSEPATPGAPARGRSKSLSL